jgi:hypothetical protein
VTAPPRYYVSVYDSALGEPGEVFWRLDQLGAHKISVSTTDYIPRVRGVNLITTLKNNFSAHRFFRLRLRPGQYFPRMARPKSTFRELSPGCNPDRSDDIHDYRVRSTGQLHIFIEELHRICRVIQPEGRNLRSYGHAIRNVLILACTEAEAHCKTILDENSYASTKRNNRLDTTDYVKLLAAMRLNQYAVRLNYYPWLPVFVPFYGWKARNPTTSIPWYHAHNLLKHDRERQFAQATLERAVTAVAGCFVMLCAQYGWDFALRDREGDRAFFQLVSAPKWAPSEIYVPPYEDGGYKKIHYFAKVEKPMSDGG